MPTNPPLEFIVLNNQPTPEHLADATPIAGFISRISCKKSTPDQNRHYVQIEYRPWNTREGTPGRVKITGEDILPHLPKIWG